jgi:RNase adaptor protein for sRNA GlmZ degradation
MQGTGMVSGIFWAAAVHNDHNYYCISAIPPAKLKQAKQRVNRPTGRIKWLSMSLSLERSKR